MYETYNKGLSIVPTAELPWYRITWDKFRAGHGAVTFEAHAAAGRGAPRADPRDGPMSATDLEPRAAIDWYWRPTNQVRAILEALAQAGILGLVPARGQPSRLRPRRAPVPGRAPRASAPLDDQRRHKLLSRYRAHGLLGSSGQAEVFLGREGDPQRRQRQAELLDAGTLIPVDVEGVRGQRFVVADDLGRLTSAARDRRRRSRRGHGTGRRVPRAPGPAGLGPRAAAPAVGLRLRLGGLRARGEAPLGLLRAADPVRRPLVGRIEPRLDRRAGILRVLDIWWEEGIDPLAEDGLAGAFGEAIAALAQFGGADRIAWPRTARHRAFSAAVRSWLDDTSRLTA